MGQMGQAPVQGQPQVQGQEVPQNQSAPQGPNGEQIPENMQGGPTPSGEDNQISQLSEQQEKQLEAYSGGIINMIYDKKTSGKVYDILKSGPPEQTIPEATLLLNQQMEQAASKAGKKPSLPVLLNTAIKVVDELMQVGHAGGFFQLNKEQMPEILEITMEKYIKNGLDNKTIDVVELQQLIEPLMTGEQRSEGMAAAQATGVPEKPGVSQAMDQYASKAVEKDRAKIAQKQSGKNMQQAQQQGGR